MSPLNPLSVAPCGARDRRAQEHVEQLRVLVAPALVRGCDLLSLAGIQLTAKDSLDLFCRDVLADQGELLHCERDGDPLGPP